MGAGRLGRPLMRGPGRGEREVRRRRCGPSGVRRAERGALGRCETGAGEGEGAGRAKGVAGPLKVDWAGRVCAGGVGPGERVRGSRPGWAACWGGKEGWAERRVWAGLGFRFWVLFPFSFFLLLFQSNSNQSNYLNSNSNLNSTLTLKQIN